MNESILKNCRVFVLEDEPLVAMMLEDMLADIGCTVAALAVEVDAALAHADVVEADIALLDVNVAGTTSFGIAEQFLARDVPVVFSTGYAVADMPAEWRDRPYVAKPFTAGDLAAALATALNAPVR